MSEDFIPLLALLVKSSLVVLGAHALASTLKALRIGAAARHFVWLTAFMALALLPVLVLALPNINFALPYSALGFATPDLSIPGQHIRDWTGAVWLWSLYAVGASVMLARLVRARMVLSKLWRRARPHTPPLDTSALAQLCGVSSPVAMRVADAPIAPMTWGHSVLLPAGAETWPAARLRAVLLHEFSHVARRDSLTLLGAAAVRALFWFNPAVWFALRALLLEQEQACDEHVLDAGADSAAYAETLLDVAAGVQHPPIGMGVSSAMVARSDLERRIIAILKPVRGRALGVVHTGVLGVALLAMSGAVAAIQPLDSARILPPLDSLSTSSQELTPLSPLTGQLHMLDDPDTQQTR